MRVLGVIAGIVLVALGSVLFVRAVMPELWLQLTQELPQRLAGVIQTDPAAEQWQAGPPVKPSPVADPGDGSPLRATVPTPEPVAGDIADGRAREAEADEFVQTAVDASGEPPDAAEPDAEEPAGAEAPNDAAPSVLNLVEDSATGFASHVAQVTGLTIEIRRSPDGVYRVGFPYSDKMEFERNIALIEARTGLRVLAEGDR